MFKHVVCQKFVDKSDAAKAAALLRALPEQIPALKSMEVGVDELDTERSFDLVLIAEFEDKEGYQLYRDHPAHQAVCAFIHPRRGGTVAVDYTVDE